MRRAPSRTSSSINDDEPLGTPAGSAAEPPGTIVSTGRTFPTGVGAPILLEGLQVIGRVRPLSLIHRSQALLRALICRCLEGSDRQDAPICLYVAVSPSG